MKNLYPLLFILLLISCKSTSQTKSSKKESVTISNQQIAEIMDTLSSDHFEGRGFGTKGIENAAVYIENFLQQNKIKPYFSQYRDSFTVGTRIGYNIVGLIEGSDPKLKNEYIILSAHYDHIGKSTNSKDTVYNGANDNASGVSAVLNIAKKISSGKQNKRSVVIALFSGEEIGLTGAEHFADKMAGNATDFYCAVNIDMIASVLTDKPGRVYISGFNRSTMGKVFNKYLGNDSIANLDNTMIFDVFGLSDNFPLYEKLKIPAHTFCTFDINNYNHYHRVTDEMKNVDIENTGIIVRNIDLGLSKILNSEAKEIVLINE